jgi:hypothetical protein
LRRRAVSRLALILCAAGLALAVAGCKNSLQIFPDSGDERWFSKPVDIFHKPDWAVASSGDVSAPLSPTKPVAPEDLVAADGRCAPHAAPPPAPAAASAPPPDRPVGSAAGDLSRAPMPAATLATATQEPGAPPVLGGVALGMSECEVVRRAGAPGNVDIGVGDQGSRKVVLTYLSGPWPGIYTFSAGRLKVVDAVAAPPAPPPEPAKTKKTKAKKKPVKPTTATREIDRVYVR